MTRSVPGPEIVTARGSHELDLVRLRLGLLLVATIVLSAIAGGLLFGVVFPDLPSRLLRLLPTVPVPAYVAAPIALALALWIIVRLMHQVLLPAEELDSSRRRLGELYEWARSHALEDSLTGLANHRAFQEEFARQLSEARRYGKELSLALIDLDDFKVVNDSAGHAVGDDLLVEMARLMRTSLRRSDRAFRTGGDEFAVLMPHTSPDAAVTVLRRLLAACVEERDGVAFGRPFSFSAGISGSPALAATQAELFNQADTALYAAKRGGRTDVRLYDPKGEPGPADQHSQARQSAAVVEVLRDRALRPFYQPIVDMQTGHVLGFEGLVRPEPGSGFDNAGSLFGAAEASGRTLELDFVCLELLVKSATGIADDQVLSVNVSPRSLESPEFQPLAFARVTRTYGFEPTRITIELTERQVVDDVERLSRVLAACRALGMRVAADDVGAGNAGLRLLSQIHFDIVKIDLSLVQAGARHESALEVLRSLNELAQRWGASVVAEGVETIDQLRAIQTVRIAAAQGYLLGRPGPTPTLRSVDLEGLSGQDEFLRALGLLTPVGPGARSS